MPRYSSFLSDPATVLLGIMLITLPYVWRQGTWVERACAVGIAVRLAIIVILMALFGVEHPVYPSRLLLAGLDLLLLTYLMGLVFTSERDFPLFIAAAALIGFVAHCVILFGFETSELDLLAPGRAGGVVMELALLIGTTNTMRRNRGAGDNHLPEQSA